MSQKIELVTIGLYTPTTFSDLFDILLLVTAPAVCCCLRQGCGFG